MNKIIMLGTGNGGTENLYNTCFVIHNEKRKELYTKEAQAFFNGNVIVPDDLETIEIK